MIWTLNPWHEPGVLQTAQVTVSSVVLWAWQVGGPDSGGEWRSFLNILHDEAARLLKASQHLILTVKDVGEGLPRLPHPLGTQENLRDRSVPDRRRCCRQLHRVRPKALNLSPRTPGLSLKASNSPFHPLTMLCARSVRTAPVP